jgi:hypothetical protein
VRRVQADAETMAADAANATQKHRPTGTADLSEDAAGRRQPSRSARRRSRAAAAPATKSKRRPLVVAAVGAGVIAAGIVLVLSLGSAGGARHAPARSASIASARLSSPSIASFASSLRSTIGMVERELRLVAVRAGARARHAQPKAKHRPSHSGRHQASAPHETAAQRGGPAATSVTSPQEQTYTQAQSPGTSSSQSSAITQSSSSSPSQPAGPTNAGPLGGIGSCVRGCS